MKDPCTEDSLTWLPYGLALQSPAAMDESEGRLHENATRYGRRARGDQNNKHRYPSIRASDRVIHPPSQWPDNLDLGRLTFVPADRPPDRRRCALRISLTVLSCFKDTSAQVQFLIDLLV